MSENLREFQLAEEVDQLRASLTNAHKQLEKARATSERLVAATLQGAKDAMLAMGPMPVVEPPKLTHHGKAEVALWHLTDWQGAKRTATYDTPIMRERVLRFCDKAATLTAVQRSDHPVKDCVVMLGGDLIEGLFNFPQQPYGVDATLFGQFTSTTYLLMEVLRRALALYRQVTVVAEWGNHGRLGAHRAAIPSSDNVDRMIVWTAREILAASGEKRLRWDDQASQGEVVPIQGDDGRFLLADIQRVQIGNYKALLIHGDEIGRKGYASPMTIVTHVAKWQSGAYPWEFRDCYMGHYHNHAEWPLPNGKGAVYQTGSPESDNRYAGVNMAASATPSQRLHFIDPRRGRVTAQYKVWIDTDD